MKKVKEAKEKVKKKAGRHATYICETETITYRVPVLAIDECKKCIDSIRKKYEVNVQ